MSDFTESVEHYVGDCEAFSVGACIACETCNPDGDTDDEAVMESADEGGFSWSQCDSCGSHFGGDRYPAHWLYSGELQHCNVCADCLMYHANGDEPEEWRQYV